MPLPIATRTTRVSSRPSRGRFSWLVVGRFTDLRDFIANAAGIVVVLGALEAHRRWRT